MSEDIEEAEGKIKKESKDKVPERSKSMSINILHYYYGGLVLIIIIVVLVSLTFATSTYAGSMLSFAATLSSILLAVIAIIITLIDVAGQRSNVLDVKNSVDELKGVTGEIKLLIQNLEESSEKTQKVTDLYVSGLKESAAVQSKKFEEIITAIEDLNVADNEKDKVLSISHSLSEIKEENNAHEYFNGLTAIASRYEKEMKQKRHNENVKRKKLMAANRAMKDYRMDFEENSMDDK